MTSFILILLFTFLFYCISITFSIERKNKNGIDYEKKCYHKNNFSFQFKRYITQ